VSWVWGTSIFTRHVRPGRCPAFRRGNYHTGQLRRYKRFRLLGLLFVLPNYISRRPPPREWKKQQCARCAFISDRLAVGRLAGHIQIDPGRRKSWSLFFHSFSVLRARAISLRALFPQRTTFSLLHIQPAGEIFSGYCSSLVFFSLSASTLHSWQKRIR
jgi:hypothetical protein